MLVSCVCMDGNQQLQQTVNASTEIRKQMKTTARLSASHRNGHSFF
jgi:hypothetical protein